MAAPADANSEARAQTEGPVGEDADEAVRQIDLGRVQREARNFQAALGHFEAAIVAAPRSVAAKNNAAQAHLDLGRLAEAEALYGAVLELAPEDVVALSGFGRIARRRHDLTGAIGYLERALARDPRAANAREALGETLQDLGRLDEAEAMFRAILEHQPEHAGAFANLGFLHRRRGDLSAAVTWFEKAIAANPRRPGMYAVLGNALRDSGRFDEAEAAYHRAIELGAEAFPAWLGLGELALRRDDPKGALAWMERAAAAKPADTGLRVRMAAILQQQHRWDEARQLLELILETTPNQETALAALGALEQARNNLAAALALFERARELAPNNRAIALQLVGALNRLNRFEGAANVLAAISGEPGVRDTELEVRQFEHLCLTQRYEAALEDLSKWGSDAQVPDGAVSLAARLYAETGQWARVLDFAAKRVALCRWHNDFGQLLEPIARAARALGAYRQAIALLDVIGDSDSSGGVQSVRERLVGEMQLVERIQSRGAQGGVAADPAAAIWSETVNTNCFVAALTSPASAPPRRRIFFCADGSYLIGACVSLFSLLRYNSASLGGCAITVFCSDEVSDLAVSILGEIGAAFGAEIDVRPSSVLLTEALEFRTVWGRFAFGQRLSQAAYHRIFAARQFAMEGGADRALYLDSDTCVLGRIDELLSFDLAGHPIGARLEQSQLTSIQRAASLLDLAPEKYFNSGVLLFDLSHQNIIELLEKCIEVAVERRDQLVFLDQCALNLAFKDNVMPLAGRFNVYVRPDDGEADPPDERTVVHFLQAPKPWDPMNNSSHRSMWMAEFQAMARLLDPERMRQVIALLFPSPESRPRPIAPSSGSAEIAISEPADASARKPDDPATLLRLRRWPEASIALTEARRLAPDDPSKLAAELATALIHLGRPLEALQALDASDLPSATHRQALWCRLNALVALGRLPEARSTLEVVVKESEDVEVLTEAFGQCARLHDGWPRTRLLQELLNKSERLAADGEGRYAELRLRTRLALGDREGFLREVDRLPPASRPGGLRPVFHKVAERMRDPAFPDSGRPKVFGIGLSRTGTTSLIKALEILQLNAAHWSNPITGALLGEEDAYLFDALGDTPVCFNFERDYHRFPNSKFIYTTRPLGSWGASLTSRLATWWGAEGFAAAEAATRQADRIPFGRAAQDINRTLYFNHGGFREAYLAYDRRVRRFFSDKPRDRFLELDLFAGEGWERLCAFLGRAQPATAFPHANARIGGSRAAAGHPSSKRASVAPREVAVTLTCGRTLNFEIEPSGDEPAGFVLGVMKSGSSLLTRLTEQVAQLNSRPFIDLANRFFDDNVLETDWTFDPALRDLVHSGAIYATFRMFPLALADAPAFIGGAKLMMVRDPRDALVSEYFSSAYSHPIPTRKVGASAVADLLEQHRREALATPIDVRVIQQAEGFLRTYRGFAVLSRQPSTTVVRYEDYIFRKPELVRQIAQTFAMTVTDTQIAAIMEWADQRPAVEDPQAFVRRVTPGDYREKLRPETIARLNEILAPAMKLFGYAPEP